MPKLYRQRVTVEAIQNTGCKENLDEILAFAGENVLVGYGGAASPEADMPLYLQVSEDGVMIIPRNDWIVKRALCGASDLSGDSEFFVVRDAVFRASYELMETAS